MQLRMLHGMIGMYMLLNHTHVVYSRYIIIIV